MQNLTTNYSISITGKYLSEDEQSIDVISWAINIFFDQDTLTFIDWEGEFRLDQMESKLPADASDDVIKAKIIELLTEDLINKVIEDNREHMEIAYIKNNRTQVV